MTDYQKTDEGFSINEIVLSTEKFDEKNIGFYVNEIHFIVLSHIFDTVIPHPLPYYLKDDPEEIMKFSFGEHGRRGYFGYY